MPDGLMPALVAMSSDEDEPTMNDFGNGNVAQEGSPRLAAAVVASPGDEDVEMGTVDPDVPALVHVSDESGDEEAESQPHARTHPNAATGPAAHNAAVRALLFSSYEWIRRGLIPRAIRDRWVAAPSNFDGVHGSPFHFFLCVDAVPCPQPSRSPPPPSALHSFAPFCTLFFILFYSHTRSTRHSGDVAGHEGG